MNRCNAGKKAAAAWLILAAALLAGRVFAAAPASLDAEFAGTGTVSINIGGGLGSEAGTVALQPDGKILTAGRCSTNVLGDFCVARFTPSGALDTSFAGTGKVITRVGTGNNQARTVLIQTDNKIVVGGSCDIGSKTGVCLVRYTSTGALDLSFGSGTGYVVEIISGDYNGVNAMALQPDGKIVVVGACYNNTNADDFCAARFTTTGALDPNFGVNGKTLIAPAPRFQTAYAVVIQLDGKIVIGGGCGLEPAGESAFCLVRLDSTGAVDGSFNGGLATSIVSNGSQSIASLAVQPNGAIVAAGACYDTTSSQTNFCVARYTQNGQLDISFGAGSGTVNTAYFGYSSYGASVLVQPDGKIVLVGWCTQGQIALFCATRYHADGAPDQTFAGGGSTLFSFESNSDKAFSAALQRDGKIVFAGACDAGTSSPSVCLARLVGGPNNFAICSADIDGDGIISTTSDSVLLARAAIGFSGAALTQGIAFGSNATRTTPESIRDFLFNQCGMKVAR